jgi:hypothetical protein
VKRLHRILYDNDTAIGRDQYNRFDAESGVKYRRNSLEIDVFTEALSTKRTPQFLAKQTPMDVIPLSCSGSSSRRRKITKKESAR